MEKTTSEEKELKTNVLIEMIRDRGQVEVAGVSRASTVRDGELSKGVPSSEEITPEKSGDKKAPGGLGDVTPGAGLQADDAAFARLAELEKIVNNKPARGP